MRLVEIVDALKVGLGLGLELGKGFISNPTPNPIKPIWN